MMRWLISRWHRRQQPSPTRKQIERQVYRHAILRSIAVRETDGFLESALFPRREDQP